MMEEGTVGTTTHYLPLRQQRRTDDNNKTHPLDATISHDEMSITMTTDQSLLRPTKHNYQAEGEVNDGGGDGGNDNPLMTIEAAEEDQQQQRDTSACCNNQPYERGPVEKEKRRLQ